MFSHQAIGTKKQLKKVEGVNKAAKGRWNRPADVTGLRMQHNARHNGSTKTFKEENQWKRERMQQNA